MAKKAWKEKIDIITYVVALAGAINWGLFAWFNFNIVELLSSLGDMWVKGAYTVIAFAGVYGLYKLFKK